MIVNYYMDQLKLALKEVEATHLRESKLVKITPFWMTVEFDATIGSEKNLTIGSTVMIGPSNDEPTGIFFVGPVKELTLTGSGSWKAKVEYGPVMMMPRSQGVSGHFFNGCRLTDEEYPNFSDKVNIVHDIKDVDPLSVEGKERKRLMELFIGFCDKYRRGPSGEE